MPMVATSPSTGTYSWVFAYLLSSGVVVIELDDPAQIRLERGRSGVNIVAVQGHPGFEPQRVARAEAAGLDPTGSEEFAPDPRCHERRHVDLEAIFAGIARARDDGRRAIHLAEGEPVVLDRAEVDVGQRLQEALGVGALQGELGVVGADG